MGTQLKITLKYLNYIPRRGMVKLPTPTFANIFFNTNNDKFFCR